MKKVNKIIQWWVTPKLPIEDIFADNTKGQKGFDAFKIRYSQWFIHPIRRRLARWYLFFLQRFFGVKIIAITGSAGKSTTVQMLSSILTLSGRVCATPPSIDPVYNIPNTILRCSPFSKYLILEMSVEYVGEMDYYLWLAKPDMGMVLNIFPTHTEFFKNKEGVAREKWKLVDSLDVNKKVILNKESKTLVKLSKKARAKVYWFGKGSEVSYKMRESDETSNKFVLKAKGKELEVKLPMVGEQFVKNAVAASACALVLGRPLPEIKTGLETFKPPHNRMHLEKHISGALILDDSYNNNPIAAMEALKTLEDVGKGKRKIVVMGDMLELGDLEETAHQNLGRLLGESHLYYLIGVGKASKFMVKEAAGRMGKNAVWTSNYEEALKKLRPRLKSDIVVLIKGSRGIGLDKLVVKLR